VFFNDATGLEGSILLFGVVYHIVVLLYFGLNRDTVVIVYIYGFNNILFF
jgi:hypothetical protein